MLQDGMPSLQCQFLNQSTTLNARDTAARQTVTRRRGTFECEACGKKVSSKQYLRQHMTTAHGAGKARKFVCETCGKQLCSKQYLRQHMATAHGVGDVRQLECQLCGKNVCSKQYLRHHMTTAHGVGDARKFECGVCSQVFNLKSSLTAHTKRVHPTTTTTTTTHWSSQFTSGLQNDSEKTVASMRTCVCYTYDALFAYTSTCTRTYANVLIQCCCKNFCSK